jgi:succinate dehydrogenase (ubiquinone) cytochrome b560 subunit
MARSTATREMSSTPGSYTERQNKTGRPVSPHVTIYAFPVAALSSIVNRVTGVCLTIGTSGIGAMALAGMDVAEVAATIGSSPVGVVAKFAVAFPLVYHYSGGFRHILWDKSPEMLTNEGVEKASYILVGFSTVVSAGVAML